MYMYAWEAYKCRAGAGGVLGGLHRSRAQAQVDEEADKTDTTRMAQEDEAEETDTVREEPTAGRPWCGRSWNMG
jgi:hypothetical protein